MKKLKKWLMSGLACVMVGAAAIGISGCDGVGNLDSIDSSTLSEALEGEWTAAQVLEKAQQYGFEGDMEELLALIAENTDLDMETLRSWVKNEDSQNGEFGIVDVNKDGEGNLIFKDKNGKGMNMGKPWEDKDHGSKPDSAVPENSSTEENSSIDEDESVKGDSSVFDESSMEEDGSIDEDESVKDDSSVFDESSIEEDSSIKEDSSVEDDSSSDETKNKHLIRYEGKGNINEGIDPAIGFYITEGGYYVYDGLDGLNVSSEDKIFYDLLTGGLIRWVTEEPSNCLMYGEATAVCLECNQTIPFYLSGCHDGETAISCTEGDLWQCGSCGKEERGEAYGHGNYQYIEDSLEGDKASLVCGYCSNTVSVGVTVKEIHVDCSDHENPNYTVYQTELIDNGLSEDHENYNNEISVEFTIVDEVILHNVYWMSETGETLYVEEGAYYEYNENFERAFNESGCLWFEGELNCSSNVEVGLKCACGNAIFFYLSGVHEYAGDTCMNCGGTQE